MDNLKNKDSFLTDKAIVVALSGGIDSVVLLHYLHHHFGQQLRAIHCNHHLSKHANQWSDFCQKLCHDLGIDLTHIDIYLENDANIEENARKKRYHSISCNLEKNEVLCTAHHQNDQAETLLLQLFRGAGVAGLSAMPKLKTLAKGFHYRPFLEVEKKHIIDFATKHKLNWIEDDSNKNTDFRRNFLRNSIIPQLEKNFKSLSQTLSRSAKHQSEALKLTTELAKIDIENGNILNNEGRILIDALKKLSAHRIKNVLRHQIRSLGFAAPSEKIMHQIIVLLDAKEDAQPLVSWQSFEVRRFQGALYFIDASEHKEPDFCPYHAEFKNLANFSIRYRSQGQRIKLPGKKHSQSLKKVLQEANIPPWERNSLRMYYIDDQLRAMERLGHMSEG